MCDAQRLLADNTTSGQWDEDNLAPTPWVDVFDHVLEIDKKQDLNRKLLARMDLRGFGAWRSKHQTKADVNVASTSRVRLPKQDTLGCRECILLH